MFKTLQSALFAAFVGLVFISLVVLALLATPRIKASSINQIGNELNKQMALMREDYTWLIRNRVGRAAMQAKVLETAKFSKSRVTVIAADGTVLADSSTPLEKLHELENHGSRLEVLQAKDEGRGKSQRFSATVEKNLIYTAVPLKDGRGGIIGYLRFSVPSTYALDLVIKIHKSLAAALIVAVLVSIVLSVFFARSFSRPIARLSEISGKIAEGKFPFTVVRHSRFEVGQLEEAVEDMSRRLSDTFNKLLAERSQVSAILSSMSEGVLATDQYSRIILANPVMEKIFGIVEPEVLGKSVRQGLRNNELAGLVDEVIKQDHKIEREIAIVSPSEATFILHASPIRSTEGDLLGVVCVLYDISELRRLEKYRSEFVANVSHELKTPLTAIRNYVETLLDGAIEDQKHNREFLGKIDKHAVNLSSLIDDILEISRLESKKELGPFTRVDMSRVVHRALDTVSEKAKKKSIALKPQCPEDSVSISGIEEHVYRAVLNLLDNAVNYTGRGGSVEITCQSSGGKVAITIADTGIGIPEEHLPRIFERFYRVDKARSRELGGTGLGLSIVKHVMNIHNGSVSVESRLGQGSKFTVTFPVSA